MNTNSSTTFSKSAVTELTVSQLRIWTGQMLSPDKPLYNMAMAFQIEGKVVASTFSDAFQKVIDTNDALRTIFREHDGVPFQHVVNELRFDTEFIDLSDFPSPAEGAGRLLRKRAQQQFILDKRLFDSALLKLGQECFIWFINQHHLICDAWSCGVLHQRLAHCYQAALDQQLSEVTPPPQFLDYRSKEYNARNTSKGHDANRYWAEKIKPDRPALELYGQRVDTTSTATCRITYDIGQERSDKLRALTQNASIRSISQDLSLYYIFSALLFVYLQRLSGQYDLIIGSPIHNRSTSAYKETLGLFVELFPLQISINPKDTFRTLIESLIPEANKLLRHSFPGASSEVPGDCYSAVLNYINVSYTDFCGMTSDCTWIHSGFGDRGHAIRLQVHDFGSTGSFTLLFDLNEEIFPPSIRECTAGHFKNLLDALLQDLDTRIDRVCLISDDEEKQLVTDFNDTAVSLPSEPSIVELVKQQVVSASEAVAIVENNLELTYNQLDTISEIIASNLTQMGIGSEDTVAVFMDRSASLIISLLGILKSGAAFVPIDTSFPEQRLEYVLEDSGCLLVLTNSNLKSALSGVKAKVVEYEEICSELKAEQSIQPEFEAIGTNSLAYMIYTSGSTGRPKGVMIEHHSLLNYLCWARTEYMADGPHDFPLFSSVAADLTITSIFLPLISGSTVVVYPASHSGLDLSIMDVFSDDRVDIIKLTPSHLALLDGSKTLPARVKKLIVGGEDFKASLARRISSLYGDNIVIYNEYGPTEATVGCMIYRFDPEFDSQSSVAIGRPINNLRIYLLDAALNHVPIGVKGDLYIAGAGLARGYHEQAGMTAETFVEDPFYPGQRMYCSGDIGRWRSLGVIEYLGRGDEQLKIRGFRVERGEIESALCEIEGITESFTQIIEHSGLGADAPMVHCRTCGLPANVPKADLDEHGICAACRNFEKQKHLADQYFETEKELHLIIERAKQTSRGAYDCLMQYSGGKDSTFALYKLVEMGMRPLVYSFDNGFISDSTKDNVRRIVEDLGLDLIWGETPAIKEIFVDSLRRFSNVCNGCQKVINTMSVTLAHEHGVNYIFTGLSRGQSFETRVADLLSIGMVDIGEIDKAVIEARKAYHQMDDAVNRYLDVSVFADETVFERIQFIDFYRYYDVPLSEILDFLNNETPWSRPSDTGRSTNCLINEAGIYIHKKERGYHNYAAPYSWDVRLGHKERENALKELEDDIDEARVHRMLREIGYDPDEKALSTIDRRIVAYYVGEREFSPEELRVKLALTLPGYMIPAFFLRMQSFPLNATGKVDQRAMPLPVHNEQSRVAEYKAPRSGVEKTLAEIWEHVLGIERIGTDDNFFDLGGDSILNIQIVSRAVKTGINITPALLFQNQTIAELAEAVSRVAPGTTPETIPPDVSEDDFTPYPLTPLQAGMLFHTLKEPNSGIYVEQYCCTLSGSLDFTILQKTWESLVRQHPVLRASFIWDDLEQPRQQINEQVTLEWHTAQEIYKSSDNVSLQIERYLREDRKRGFQLSDPPLMRFAIFDLGSGSYRFIWTFHHIICDGWATTQIIQEMVDEYQAIGQGQTIFEVPERPYRDYVAWINQQDLIAAKHFWVKELSGIAEPTPLPVYNIDSQRQGYGKRQRSFSAELTTSLNAEARSRRLTVNTIVQGAWALLLHFHSGDDDVMFGTTVSGRPPSFEGAENMVGLFINTLPIRVRVEHDKSFSDWLAALLAKQIKIRNYEYSPLVDIQEWSEFQAGVSLFETIVVFENVPAARPGTMLQVNFTVDQVDYLEQSNFPISIIALPGQQLQLAAYYDRKFFSEDHIFRLLGHLQKIIKEFVENPDQPLHSLSLLSQHEQNILSTWHGKTSTSRVVKTVQELFEEQATLNAEKNAVCCKAETLSYQELNDRANRFAHYLMEQEFPKGSYQAIFMDRSVDMIVAILSVLKAGLAYVPLDPDYPASRIGYMLADVKPSTVLTHQRLASILPNHEIPIVCIDNEDLGLEQYSDDNPDISSKHDDIAYVIYTSGSTGTPKGVMITHGNLYNSTYERIEYYKTPPERFLLLSSISFDSSVAGIFGTLCAGGFLHIPNQHKFRDVDYLAELIDRHHISEILAIPSLYEHLLQFYAEKISSLKTVIVAGETCGNDLLEAHRSILPHTALFNEYGPTEATVWSTVFECNNPDPTIAIPIGKPIGNMKAFVLDEKMRQVPPGVAGELYLGGASISPGYLNRPKLTSERFLQLSLPGSEEQRFYKTGDVVRFLDDGSLQFLGRNDEQIKMRGYRIELGEIESVLRKMPTIKQVAVVPKRSLERTDKQSTGAALLNQAQITGLVAYVTLDTDKQPKVSELKSALRDALPDHMIPSDFIVLDTLPLHPNGKIDKARLSYSSSFDEHHSEGDGVFPETDLEKDIAAVWADVLNLDRILRSDNFFDLGGHSILLVQLASRLQGYSTKKITISDLYQAQTVEMQAKLLGDQIYTKDLSSNSDSDTTFFWIHGEGSNRLLSKYLKPEQKLYFLFHQSRDGKKARFKTIEQISQYYLKEIRHIQKQGPYSIGGYCVGGVIAFEIAQQLINEGETVDHLFLLDPSETKGKPKKTETSRKKHGSKNSGFAGIKNNLKRSINLKISKRFEEIKLITSNKNLRKQIIKEGGEKVRLQIAKLFLALGFPIPQDLRGNYIIDIYNTAMKNYLPKDYPASIIIFHSGETQSLRKYYSRPSKFHWSDIKAKNITILKNNDADHHSIVVEPHIATWAKHLNHYLQNNNE